MNIQPNERPIHTGSTDKPTAHCQRAWDSPLANTMDHKIMDIQFGHARHYVVDIVKRSRRAATQMAA